MIFFILSQFGSNIHRREPNFDHVDLSVCISWDQKKKRSHQKRKKKNQKMFHNSRKKMSQNRSKKKKNVPESQEKKVYRF